MISCDKMVCMFSKNLLMILDEPCKYDPWWLIKKKQLSCLLHTLL
jgi:hypothetical protein